MADVFFARCVVILGNDHEEQSTEGVGGAPVQELHNDLCIVLTALELDSHIAVYSRRMSDALMEENRRKSASLGPVRVRPRGSSNASGRGGSSSLQGEWEGQGELFSLPIIIVEVGMVDRIYHDRQPCTLYLC